MKTIITTLTSALIAFSLCNCQNPTGHNTQQGAVVGGLGGAAVGGIIGHQSGNTAQGALIGGALGAGTGALIGNQRD